MNLGVTNHPLFGKESLSLWAFWFIYIGHVLLEISAKEVTTFVTQSAVGVILLGSFLISDPHVALFPLFFQSVVLTLKLIGTRPPHEECDVCNFPMPLMQSHSNNI